MNTKAPTPVDFIAAISADACGLLSHSAVAELAWLSAIFGESGSAERFMAKANLQWQPGTSVWSGDPDIIPAGLYEQAHREMGAAWAGVVAQLDSAQLADTLILHGPWGQCVPQEFIHGFLDRFGREDCARAFSSYLEPRGDFSSKALFQNIGAMQCDPLWRTAALRASLGSSSTYSAFSQHWIQGLEALNDVAFSRLLLTEWASLGGSLLELLTTKRDSLFDTAAGGRLGAFSSALARRHVPLCSLMAELCPELDIEQALAQAQRHVSGGCSSFTKPSVPGYRGTENILAAMRSLAESLVLQRSMHTPAPAARMRL